MRTERCLLCCSVITCGYSPLPAINIPLRVWAGLTSDAELGPVALEFAQGDSISGKVLRKEVAQVVAAALSSPAAVGGAPALLCLPAGKTAFEKLCLCADALCLICDQVHVILIVGAGLSLCHSGENMY